MSDLSGLLQRRCRAAPAGRAVPRHVAIVMDGNGRWARQRFMPRFFGHKQGVDALVRAVNAFADRGVEYLTVFAFSSENWKRPHEEVSGLMSLVLVGVSQVPAQAGRRRRAHPHRGRPQRCPTSCARPGTRPRPDREQHRITLSVAFNYGGRWDVVQACRAPWPRACGPNRSTNRAVRHMALAFAPDPDLFIRTGGEMRISNFLLWQAAYAELFFTDCLWPDFGDYRDRRRAGRLRPARPPLRRRPPTPPCRKAPEPVLRQRIITALVLLAMLLAGAVRAVPGRLRC
jgi:undecaprenyl diphosphate synthase